MKCKIHPYEPGVGVCATCLRQRLVALVALTEGSTNQEPSLTPSPPHRNRQHQHDHHQQPPPYSLLFPRSVSPYISHRRSLGESPSLQHHHHLFYSTPQVTSTAGGIRVGVDNGGVPSGDLPRNKRRTFSLLSALFGFRSNHHQNKVSENLPADFNSSPFDSRVSDSGALRLEPKQSWLSSFAKGKKKKKKVRGSPASTEVSSAFTTREFSTTGMGREWDRRRRENRGLSPKRDDMDQELEEEWVDTPGSRKPAPTPMRRYRRTPVAGHRGMSGISAFLSPLVQASPQRRCQVGSGENGYSGELRSGGSVNNGPSVLGLNRSRKLADLGRFK